MKTRRPSISDDAFTRASAAWEAGELELAFALFLGAARQGDSSAQLGVGYFYDCGIGVPKNTTRALFWYRAACKAGSSAAACNIATVHRDAGACRKQVWWLRRAVKMGDGDALLDLGRCYLRGKGTKRNRARAIACFRALLVSSHVTEDSEEQAKKELRRLVS